MKRLLLGSSAIIALSLFSHTVSAERKTKDGIPPPNCNFLYEAQADSIKFGKATYGANFWEGVVDITIPDLKSKPTSVSDVFLAAFLSIATEGHEWKNNEGINMPLLSYGFIRKLSRNQVTLCQDVGDGSEACYQYYIDKCTERSVTLRSNEEVWGAQSVITVIKNNSGEYREIDTHNHVVDTTLKAFGYGPAGPDKDILAEANAIKQCLGHSLTETHQVVVERIYKTGSNSESPRSARLMNLLSLRRFKSIKDFLASAQCKKRNAGKKGNTGNVSSTQSQQQPIPSIDSEESKPATTVR